MKEGSGISADAAKERITKEFEWTKNSVDYDSRSGISVDIEWNLSGISVD